MLFNNNSSLSADVNLTSLCCSCASIMGTKYPLKRLLHRPINCWVYVLSKKRRTGKKESRKTHNLSDWLNEKKGGEWSTTQCSSTSTTATPIPASIPQSIQIDNMQYINTYLFNGCHYVRIDSFGLTKHVTPATTNKLIIAFEIQRIHQRVWSLSFSQHER